ncbi:MAG: amidohydrolase family protein, partial [Longimicrobiales bacterium]
MRTALLLLALSLTTQASAQQQPPRSDRVVAIRAGRLLEVSTGTVVENATIVVRNDRIEAVGRDVRVPAGAQVIDLSDQTVMPGFIDMHTHITGDPSDGYSDQVLHEWPGYEAIVGVKNARKTLMAGFTAVRNVGAGDWSDVALRDAIGKDVVPGPRVFPAANALGITGGHCDTNGYRPDLRREPGPEQGIANGIDEVRRAVRYQIKYGAAVIKICATGGVLSAGDAVGVQQYTLDEMKAIVETAAFSELKVAAHAHGREGIKQAVQAGVASIEHGSLLDDEAIDLMLQKGTYLVPTQYLIRRMDMTRLPALWRRKAEYLFPLKDASLEKAIKRRVKIAFGTDAAVYPHGENAREFAEYVRLGMTPLDAIRCATTHAADLLGVDDRGVIAPG